MNNNYVVEADGTYTVYLRPDANGGDDWFEKTIYLENTTPVPTEEPTETPAEGCYVKVTEAPDDWSGEYLIVYEGESIALDGGLTSMDVRKNYISVTISEGKIVSDETTDAAKFTIEPITGGYSIKSASGLYIGGVSGSNTLKLSSGALKNKITLKGSDADIVSGTAHLRFNEASTESRFRYFKATSYSKQQPIQLYKLIGGSVEPTEVPSEEPTEAPTEEPTEEPTEVPTETPTEEPTEVPTETPTEEPTEVPTETPTEEPTETPAEGCYVKVTEDQDDWSGEYLIVYEGDSIALDGGLTSMDAKKNYINVTISEGKIVSNETTDAAKFTIEAINGGYSIKSASGLYIGGVSGSNTLKLSSDALKNVILLDGTDADIISATSHLRFNAASDQTRFRYFKSTTYTNLQPIQLYKLTGSEEPTYTITWKNDDGSVIDTTTVAKGEIPTHDDPTKADDDDHTYTFAGWTPEVVAADENATYTATYIAKDLVKIGDVDGDGNVTILDATAIQRYLADMNPDPFIDAVADVDGDGDISVLDATFIRRYLVELDDGYPIGQKIAVDLKTPH